MSWILRNFYLNLNALTFFLENLKNFGVDKYFFMNLWNSAQFLPIFRTLLKKIQTLWWHLGHPPSPKKRTLCFTLHSIAKLHECLNLRKNWNVAHCTGDRLDPYSYFLCSGLNDLRLGNLSYCTGYANNMTKMIRTNSYLWGILLVSK